MSMKLRVLLLEDRPADVELVLYELRRAGFDPEWQCVDTEEGYLEALSRPDYQIILADYTLPQFNALKALHLLQERGLDIPFIVVTGSISEEVAVECMREGAADYLIKDRLARLGQAITHALYEKVLRDEHRRAEAALRESEARFRTLAESTAAGIAIIQGERIVYANPALARLNDASHEEILRMNFWDMVHPDYRSHAAVLTGRWQQGQPMPRRGELKILTRQGTERWLDVTAGAITLHDAPALIITGFDITERKRAEQAVRESEEQFRIMFNEALDVIMIIDGESGEILNVNRAVTRILGYEVEDLIGQPVSVLVPHELESPAADLLERLRASEARFEAERILRVDGSLCPMDLTATVIPWGDATAILTTFRDVTERDRRERELASIVEVTTVLRNVPHTAGARADLLPIILEQLVNILGARGTAIVIHDPASGEATVELAGGAWAAWTGTIIPPEHGLVQRVIMAGQPHLDNDFLAGSHTRYEPPATLRCAACAPLITQERTIGALCIGRDIEITREDIHLLAVISDIIANALERVEAMDLLEQRVQERTAELAAANERLQELDRLKSKFVSDVTHELRTPVTNLGMYVYLLGRDRPEKREKHLEALKQQVARFRTLTEHILDISRLEMAREHTKLTEVDLNSVVESVYQAHIPRAEASGLQLTFTPARELPPVRGERNQLAQVVENLIANAINYTPSGYVKVSTYADDEHHAACLCVEDSGIGIDEADMPYLFDRFYRGVRASQAGIPGTGLGLGIVKEIVEIHQGEIRVKSTVGKGSAFQIYLPLYRH